MSTGTPRRGLRLAIALAAAAVLAVAVVLVARWLRADGPVADFVATYPGTVELPEWAPVGIPGWVAWQHLLNAFLLVLLVRSGLLIRMTRRPAAFWTRRRTGLLGRGRAPRRHSINHWLHFSLDWLWIANGVVFVVLIAITGHWIRIVPTSWEFVPHAVSVAIQYASLDWPVENGWVHYNALQTISYFVTVFVAAPLAAATGLRMSPLWRDEWRRASRIVPVEAARRVHFPVMLYFAAFTVVHVLLVLTTGARRNLNHMFAARDDDGWLGLAFFVAAVVVMVAAWLLARPMLLRPVAQLTGSVTR